MKQNLVDVGKLSLVITKHKLNNYLVVHISVFVRKVCQSFCPEILIVFRLETLTLPWHHQVLQYQ